LAQVDWAPNGHATKLLVDQANMRPNLTMDDRSAIEGDMDQRNSLGIHLEFIGFHELIRNLVRWKHHKAARLSF